jgi:hypothetical protein
MAGGNAGDKAVQPCLGMALLPGKIASCILCVKQKLGLSTCRAVAVNK